jgi:hypothetical protein
VAPSIFDMFDGADGESPFTGEGIDAALDRALKDRPVAGRPVGYDPSNDGGATPPAPSPDGEVQGAEGGAPAAPAAGPPEPPAPPPPAPALPAAETPPPALGGPLADLSEMEQLELSQLRQALADPERALNVRRAMLGVETPAPAAVPPPAAPTPPPAPTLPEDIEPGSFEAQMWQDNQDMRRQIAEMQQGRQADQEQTEQERMNAAARRATTSFTAKYGQTLTQAEIQAVCQHAGLRKLPEAFYAGGGDWDKAMTEALEYVVRSDDALLGRVLGAPAPPPTPGPGTRTAEATDRGRKLTALSSAASPSGDAPTRAPIEHRPDGKLTEKSRLQLVQEMMSGAALTGSPE